MLRYKIRNPKAAPRKENSTDPFLSKQSILGRHITKCFFKPGDRIRLKKPKRNPVYGTLVDCIDDADKVEWRGNTPLFLVVDLEKVDKQTGVVYGAEIKTVGVKQLSFVSAR